MTHPSQSGKLSGILNLQTFAIILVVLGHSVPRGTILPYPPLVIWLHSCIYSFHMPLFMFLSGYLFIYSNRDRAIKYPAFIGNKVIRLLVPYLVLSSLAYLPKVIMSKYAFRPIELSFSTYIRGIVYPLENPIIAMWFLPVLFSIFLAAPLMKRAIDLNRTGITLGLLTALAALNVFNPLNVYIFGIQITTGYAFYFFLGCVVADRFRENLAWSGKIYFVLISFAMFMLVNLFLPQLDFRGPALLAAVIGICFSITLAYFMDNHGRRFFGYIDGYSYQIYLLSWFIQVFFRILYQGGRINEYACFGLMLAGGVIVPVLIAKLVERKLPALKIFIGLK